MIGVVHAYVTYVNMLSITDATRFTAGIIRSIAGD